MKRVLARLPGYNPRRVLIGIALVLLLVNLYSWLGGHYRTMKVDVDSKVALLESYQRQKGRLVDLSEREAKLRNMAGDLKKRLFAGAGESEVASAMQIKLQSMVKTSGIESESIRPVAAPVKDKGGKAERIIPLVVKMRLTGTMPEFLTFMKLLYGDETPFRIKVMTVRSYRKAGVKIFLELRGYYQLNPGSDGLDGAAK